MICIDLNQCQSNPCLNGGKCFYSINSNRFLCKCVEKWNGTYCETEKSKYKKEFMLFKVVRQKENRFLKR